MEIRRPDANTVTTFQEFADGGFEARMYRLEADGNWSPPLPVDVLGQLPAERSRSGRRATLERVGGVTSFGSARTGQRRPRRPAAQRPSWQLGDAQREYSYREIEIRSHPTEARQFSVSLGSTAREFIRDELARVRRQFGEPRETGGWLFVHRRPRAWWDHLSIALATTAGDSQHERSAFAFGATANEISRGFPPHFDHLSTAGDWHSHAIAGSTIPSDSDARAWTLMLDQQVLERYVGVIVSPSESLGWTSPVFSAWSVTREGASRKPICEPATLGW